MTARILYTTVYGRQIRLTGTFDDKVVTGTGAIVGAVLFVPVVGFFTTGTSARISAGSGVKGFIGEDFPLAFASVQPAPMAVQAAFANAAVPAANAIATSAVATPK